MERLINYAGEEGNTFLCVDCGKETFFERDLLLCEDCMDKYDTDKIWKLHDENKIDALDCNESKKFREQFLKVNHD